MITIPILMPPEVTKIYSDIEELKRIIIEDFIADNIKKEAYQSVRMRIFFDMHSRKIMQLLSCGLSRRD